MKKLFVILSIISCIIISGGCAKHPREVAKDWVQALVDGDLDKANNVSTGEIHPYNKLLIDSLNQQKRNVRFDKVELTQRIDAAEVEIDGDIAKIYIDKHKPILLRKVDGAWKIDRFQ